VDWKNSRFSKDRKDTVPLWLHGVYGHDGDHPKPQLAAKVFHETPGLVGDDLYAACAAGDEDVILRAIAADPTCVHRTAPGWRCPGCKKTLTMPPLIAVTFSSLVQVPEFRERLYRCARLLIEAGADVNSADYKENDHPLSALYGAAGKNQDAGMTRLLLEAGASPNDGESLFHAQEERGTECVKLLLKAGAKVDGHILCHTLDFDDLEKLRLMLAHTDDVNDSRERGESPLLYAIRKGRSRAHVEMLLAKGADPNAKSKDGRSAYKLALANGLPDVAELLPPEPLTIEEEFVAACARADEMEARRLLREGPDMFKRLSEAQLQQLPLLTGAGKDDAVRLMVRLGWPIQVKAGDWQASAINQAVFAGNSKLARFLLEHGASWTEEHGYGDNVNGTLSWASRNMSPANDYIGCAQALLDHGMPLENMEGPDYSDEVKEFVAAERAKRAG
jgi:ankyrin repeat protein